MSNEVTREKLAAEFTRQVRSLLADKLDEINRLNATKEYIGCCATHDFYDTNECMLVAYSIVAEIPVDDIMLRDTVMELMNEAWDLAKLSRFELISTVLAKFPNFKRETTGGGCMAWIHPKGEGHILITELDGCDLPTDDDYSVTCGEYDELGNCVGGDANTPEIRLCELETWIDDKLGFKGLAKAIHHE